MSSNQKLILTAVLAFLAAAIFQLQNLQAVIKNVLSSENVAGSGAGVGGVAGSSGSPGGSPAAGVGGLGGAGGRAGSGGATSGSGGSGGSASAPRSGFSVGVNTWFVVPDWGFGSVFSSNANFATWQTTSVWNPAFIKELQTFRSIRLMDASLVNASRVTSWAQRRLPTDPGNKSLYTDAATTAVIPGMAYELMFDLAKRANLDTLWVNLPMLADDDYITQFASLAKAQLPIGTKLVVEWSNEPDGGWFMQTSQAQQRAAALGLPGENQFYQGGSFTTLRTIALRKAFSGDSRVSVARCGVGNTDILRQSLTNVYKSSKWNPTNEKIDILCMSFYWGNGRDGNTYTLAQAKQDIDGLVSGEDGVSTFKALQTQFGISRLAVYEGGQHTLQNSANFNRTQPAADGMAYMLDKASATGLEYFFLYTDVSSWSNNSGSGSWGLWTSYGGAETLKSMVVVNWVNTH